MVKIKTFMFCASLTLSLKIFGMERGMEIDPSNIASLESDFATIFPSSPNQLHWAAYTQGIDEVNAILSALKKKEGERVVNARDEKGATAAWIAASRGRLEILQFLHGAGADLQQPDCWGRSPLHAAVRGGHLDVVEYLCTQVLGSIYVSDNFGRTPLHEASYNQHRGIYNGKLCAEIVTFLLDRGARPLAQDRWGKTPIDLAFCDQLAEVIEIYQTLTYHEAQEAERRASSLLAKWRDEEALLRREKIIPLLVSGYPDTLFQPDR